MRIRDMNWMQVEARLKRDDRAVLPIGSTEQHAYLSLATDSVLAERVAIDAAEPLQVPVFPALAYGITPGFMAYPGTVTVSAEHYFPFLRDVLDSIATHGFRRILVVNGHGGNTPARVAAYEWMARRGGVQLLWHDWWNAPATMARVRSIDLVASHASWMESFEWTRVEGVDPPEGEKPLLDMNRMKILDPRATRDYLGDGSFGGRHRQSDEAMRAIWEVAVEETRELLTSGWV
ncbi:MAG: creatininase family protein [Candidatus Eisenbacteria bacterium]